MVHSLPPKPPPPVVHAPPRVSRKRKRLWVWITLALVLALLGAAGFFLYVVHLGRETARIQSTANLRQIGLGLLLYANDYSGRYPDTLSNLFLAENISSDVFVAPNSHDTPATGSTRQAIAANLAVPGHCSYVYLGKGLRCTRIPDNAVIVYEPPALNDNQGGNVFFNDGHADFLDMAAMNSILAQIKSGLSPVCYPPAPAATTQP